MLHRTLTISFHALCLLPALALSACDPKLNLGDLFGDEGSDEGQGDDQGDEGGDDQGDEGQGDGGPGDEGQGDEGQTGAGSESGAGDETTGEPPDPFECDVWAQDCPEGEKCAPYGLDGGSSWNALKCVPLDPAPAEVGDPCENPGPSADGLDNCEEGSMCWNVDASGFGICVAHCQGSEQSPSCDAGFSCVIANDGVLPICLPDCDPLLQDCAAGDTCIPVNDHFNCALDASGAAGEAFDACEFANACDPGLLCVTSSLASECDPNAPGCCLPYCDLDNVPSDCPGVGQECLPWYAIGTAPPGQDNLGLCQVP